MDDGVELVVDDKGIAVLGKATDVERFLLSSGLEQMVKADLDLHRLRSHANSAGAGLGVAADVAVNSGRWVKLTAESAEKVRKYGLMPTKTRGVSHAMIGDPGDIKTWIQIVTAPTAVVGNPLVLTSISTMMQQQAMQQQMDEIVEYLQEISEKVDDILRGQKDAVLSDLIGVDLIIEDALLVRDRVGRVSDVTWSKVQGTAMAIARTQAYALRQLDAIAEKLAKQSDLGDVAKATREAEPKVREWLAVLARTFQLQDGVAVLELDRVLDGAPEDWERHRAGLVAARENRVELIARTTERLLVQMDRTIERANSRVLFNPFDSPAAVRTSNRVADGVLDFRGVIGIETGRDAQDARRWRTAAADVRDRVLASAADGVDRTADIFRPVDTDGDGVADKRKIAVAAEEAGTAIADAASGVRGAFGTLFKRKAEQPAVDDGTPSPPDPSDEPVKELPES